jgi:hypothetical protein
MERLVLVLIMADFGDDNSELQRFIEMLVFQRREKYLIYKGYERGAGEVLRNERASNPFEGMIGQFVILVILGYLG